MTRSSSSEAEIIEKFGGILTCRVCGFKASNLIGHISARHGTVAAYREQYPGELLNMASHNQRRLTSERMKGKPTFNGKRSYPSEVVHWTRKGFTVEEAEEKISAFQREMSDRSKNSEFAKQRRKECSTGDNNPMSLSSIAKRHGVSIEEATKLTPCYGRSGILHPMFGKHHTPEALEKIGSSLTIRNVSNGEKLWRERVFTHLGRTGLVNKTVGRYVCDVVFPDEKIIFEFFGDYWHANPSVYPPDWINSHNSKVATDTWLRDETKVGRLKALGYTVIVVWESDWVKTPHKILEELSNAFNS